MGNLVSSVERDENGAAEKITFAWGMAEIVVIPGPKIVAIRYWVARELIPQWVIAKIMKQAAAIFAEAKRIKSVAENPKIEVGDTVYHKPSEETWVVYSVGEKMLSWCGWPPGEARIEDCVLLEKATKEQKEFIFKGVNHG